MRSPYVPDDLNKAQFLNKLLVYELEEDWRLKQLIQDLWFYSAELRGILIAPLGSITNYASSPRPFWGLVTPDGPWKWATVMHDVGSRGGLVTPSGQRVHLVKHLTDRLFREAMSVYPCRENTSATLRWIMYRGVVLKGSGAYGGVPLPPVEGPPDPPEAA